MSAATLATISADALSLKLFHLTEIVKLAAFSVESRRVLEVINRAAHYRPEMQKIIDDSLGCPNTWKEMDDSAGNVLDYLARELGTINTAFVETVYDLAKEKTGGAA